MSVLQFRSKIEINSINPYVLVSAKRAARLKSGWRKPSPVRLSVNGRPDTPWRVNLMPVGDGEFYLYLHGAVRKASGTKVGDIVSLELDFDNQYKGGPASSAGHARLVWRPGTIHGSFLERDIMSTVR